MEPRSHEGTKSRPKHHARSKRHTLEALGGTFAAVMLVGCGNGPGAVPAASVAGAEEQVATSEMSDAQHAKGRAQLWTENCPRCHNARPATFYTLREWDVAMHHMRVRCALTAMEHKKIMEFFEASK